MQEPTLSPYGRASTVLAPIGRLMAEFAAGFREGVDVNLGAGYICEDAIPRAALDEALHAVLAEQKNGTGTFFRPRPATTAAPPGRRT